MVCGVQSQMGSGRGPHPTETQGENQRRLRVPRGCMCSPPNSPGGPGVMASRCDVTDPDGRGGVRPGSGVWVQVSRVKEPSCARSQARTLRGALGPQGIQVVNAFSPGRPRQGCRNEPPSPACLSGVLAGESLVLRGARSG